MARARERTPRKRRRPRPRPGEHTNRCLLLLAYLLLADGRFVRTPSLGAKVYPGILHWGVGIHHAIERLVDAGVAIEERTRPRQPQRPGPRSRSVRLVELPPDELLAPTLRILDRIKAGRRPPTPCELDAWLDDPTTTPAR